MDISRAPPLHLQPLVRLEGFVGDDARLGGVDRLLGPAQKRRPRADGGGPARDLVAGGDAPLRALSASGGGGGTDRGRRLRRRLALGRVEGGSPRRLGRDL